MAGIPAINKSSSVYLSRNKSWDFLEHLLKESWQHGKRFCKVDRRIFS
jgi:hypothetical protein